MNKEAIIEAAKEAFRLALFAAVAAIVAYVSQLVEAGDPASLWVLVGTAILRIVDKYIHEDPDIKLNGLSPV